METVIATEIREEKRLGANPSPSSRENTTRRRKEIYQFLLLVFGSLDGLEVT